jgi:hypothetical protein
MPSSLEQRIGRIDRVRSQTERRLTTIESEPDGEHLLQVFYPYLPETVEVFQVDRVFERLDRFIRLMHERFGAADDDGDRKVDVQFEAARGRRRSLASTARLESAFPVKREMTTGPDRELAVVPRSEQEALVRFQRLAELAKDMPIEWRPGMGSSALVGTLNGARRQPFTLVLHSVNGALNVRCISPVGQVDPRADTERIAREARLLRARLGAVYDPRFRQYQLTVEGDILLGHRASDLARARWLVATVAAAADRMEEILLEVDLDPASFHEDLAKEADFER